MFVINKDVSATPVTLSKADNNLLNTGGALSISVAEVGGDDPKGLEVGNSVDRAAGNLERSCVRMSQSELTLADAKARQKEEVPIIRDAAFGIANAVRFADPAVFQQLPLQSAYGMQDPVFFIDRCMLVFEADRATFAPFVDLLATLRNRIVGLDGMVRKAVDEKEQAEKQYTLDRLELQKVLKEGTSYVVSRARKGSPALTRLKKNSGKRPSKAKPAPEPIPAPGVPSTPPAAKE